MEIILRLENISKFFGTKNRYPVLLNIDLEVKKGEIIALIGSSGSGKSTLLQIAGLLDKPSNGKVFIKDIDCCAASDNKRTLLRRNYLGFVYQFHHLLQDFSIMENVMFPQILIGKSKKVARDNANEILERLGLSNKKELTVGQLSGGERQRVAIARGLINCPVLFLADEPTGNLDPQTSSEIFTLLCEYVKQRNISVFLVTHNYKLSEKADRVYQIKECSLEALKS